jgi:hypothetical protein
MVDANTVTFWLSRFCETARKPYSDGLTALYLGDEP